MKNERNKVKETAHEYISLSGTIAEVAARLDGFAAKYTDEATLETDTDWEGNWSGSVIVTWYRDETDKEYERRLARNQTQLIRTKEKVEKDKIKKEKEERKLLEQLKKKYG